MVWSMMHLLCMGLLSMSKDTKVTEVGAVAEVEDVAVDAVGVVAVDLLLLKIRFGIYGMQQLIFTRLMLSSVVTSSG